MGATILSVCLFVCMSGVLYRLGMALSTPFGRISKSAKIFRQPDGENNHRSDKCLVNNYTISTYFPFRITVSVIIIDESIIKLNMYFIVCHIMTRLM